MLAHIGSKKEINLKKYIFEPKFDGIRALCYVNTTIKFFSRNGQNITTRFPELNFRKNIKARSCILDGEIVAYDQHGNPSFELLQQGYITTYVVFDILEKNGKSFLQKPLEKRKEILKDIIKPTNHLEIVFYTSDGEKLWNLITKRGLEGILAKERKSFYLPGKRSSAWLKIKTHNTLDCIIVGYTQNRRAISSLALGLFNAEKKIQYIGLVGTGFSESFIADLYPKLKKLEISNALVINPYSDIFWVKPRLIAEISYRVFTHRGILRHSVFLRLRSDKKPKECTIDDQLNSKERKLVKSAIQ